MPGKIIKSSSYEKLQRLQTTLFQNPKNARAGIVQPQLGADIGFGGLQCLSDNPSDYKLILDFMRSPDKLMKSQLLLSGYDESIFQYSSLEGNLRAYAHCINNLSNKLDEYVPVIFLSLGFFTASKLLVDANHDIGGMIHEVHGDGEKESTNIGDEERFDFLKNHSERDSILFIDGPIFTGASTSYNYRLSEQLPEKNCFPVFVVKNSNSDIITSKFNFGYNNDLHWAYNVLPTQSRTAYFRYSSETKTGSAKRTKVFCYLKPGSTQSPCRVEMSENVYNELKASQIDGTTLLELIEQTIVYQFILNGLKRNNQIRIIEVAEMYAREALKSTHIYQLADQFGLTATMNESRGFN